MFIIQCLNTPNDGQYLTNDFLQFSPDPKDAQVCDSDEAAVLIRWLETIGVKATAV